MKKLLILSALPALLLLVGCTAKAPAEPALEEGVAERNAQIVTETDPEVETGANTGEDVEVGSEEESEAEIEAKTETDPIIKSYSLEALKDSTFSGNSLRLEATLAENAAYTRHRISYNSNGTNISGILNIPQGEGPFPVAILNHGFIEPSIYTVGRGLKRTQDALARAGYAVLHTDYRNHGLSDEDQLLEENYVFRSYFYAQDSINAILALENRDDPRIDTTRVGMLGHSMGGGVTMHAMLARPELIDAVVLYAPVHSNERNNFHHRRVEHLTDEEHQERTQKLGNLQQPENFTVYSAYPEFPDRASDHNIPVKIYHGTNDQSVPYDRSVTTRDHLSEAGANVELITYEGEGHEFTTYRNDFITDVTEFFDTNVK